MNAWKKGPMKSLLSRGKGDDSEPAIISFIKVMIHNRFSDFLFIPPRFGPELASLVNKDIQVADVSGRHWTVALSHFRGKLAFRQGWNAFVSDHGIMFGDTVIFHYILDSKFVVQIFGKSGCEKLEFPSSSHSARNKRAKTPRSFVDNDSTTSSEDVVNVNNFQDNKKGSSKAHLSESSHQKGVKRQLFEDPCCIINRDVASPTTVERCFIDLSELEMCKTKPVCENGNSSMKGDREEQINESSFFRENILDFGAFQADMEILNDSRANESLNNGEISGQILPESRPSVFSVSATEHKMKLADAPAGPSREARVNDSLKRGKISGQTLPESCAYMSAASATGHKTKHTDVSAGPSQGARASDSLKHGEISGPILPESRPSMSTARVTVHKMKHADVSAGPSREAQTASFKAQAATSGAQTPTLRGAAKGRDEINPKSFGAGPNASLRIAKKENKNFNPEELFGGSAKIVNKDHKEVNPKSFGGSVKIVKKELSPESPGGNVRIVKKELKEDNPQNFGKRCNANGSLQENRASVSGPPLKKVKAEVVDLDEPPSPLTVTCLVASDDSFLEMPHNFFLSRLRARMELAEKWVLLLQDSAGKQWPVLYLKKAGVKAITCGWKQFREANRIRLGDQCVFELKDESESIYQVHVIHK